MMRRTAATLALALGLLAMATDALAAPVTARLDRDHAVVGETVTLELVTEDPQQSLETDLSVLNADFIVLDQRSETQMSIVNGRQAAVVRLMVTLEPRRTGALQVPPLKFRGGVTTTPIALQVGEAPQPQPGEAEPVFIETVLEPQEGPYYVHAQLSLRVRIFYRRQVLTEATINPPAPEQSSVRLLDELPYEAERNGQRYSVLERRYAIFPERSGTLSIPPMVLTGRLVEPRSDRLWQPAPRGRRASFHSEPLVLEILPRPQLFSGDAWLPARSLDLAQQITDADALRVGEPVTRTVILDAVGLDEHMLEEPKWPQITNARVYPDQPQGISRDDGEWVLGHREFRYAVVPEQPGELVLPEIRLAWWDTVADRERVAVLPEHRVQVAPAEPVAGAAPAAASPATQPGEAGAAGGDALAWRLLAGLFALLWLATLVLYLRGARTAALPEPADEAPDARQELEQLGRACRAGDARAARAHLGRWLRHFGPAAAAGTLEGLARLSGPELAAELRALDAAGFSAGADGNWKGEGLWTAFNGWRKSRRGEGRVPAEDLNLYEAAKANSGKA